MFAAVAMAQQAPLPQIPPPPPPGDGQGAPLPAPPQTVQSFPPQELDRIVSPIALYPDPLLAQILAAATFSPDIPAAAAWADRHHYVPADQLPAAMAADQLTFQPSVQALLPFPQILDMMASDMPWTEEIGAAFLSSPPMVMDAVQRQRQVAYGYGYLRSNAQVMVRPGPYIEVLPVNPQYVVVPYYDPRVVFVAPRPGFNVIGAIRFGYGIHIGVAFSSWGWGATSFGWSTHAVIVNGAPWARTWANRAVYVHPYPAVVRYRAVGHPPEIHTLHERTARERAAEREGHRREEHR
jgi:hypothetical protein